MIDTLSKNYDITLVDSHAGLEHFVRKTGRNVTGLVVVTDPSKKTVEINPNCDSCWNNLAGCYYDMEFNDRSQLRLPSFKNPFPHPIERLENTH